MRPPQIQDENGVLVIVLDDPGSLNDGQTLGIRQPLFGAVQAADAPRVAVDLGAIEFLTSSGSPS